MDFCSLEVEKTHPIKQQVFNASLMVNRWTDRQASRPGLSNWAVSQTSNFSVILKEHSFLKSM